MTLKTTTEYRTLIEATVCLINIVTVLVSQTILCLQDIKSSSYT